MLFCSVETEETQGGHRVLQNFSGITRSDFRSRDDSVSPVTSHM